MNRQIGISFGILACFYLIYALIKVKEQRQTTEMKEKQSNQTSVLTEVTKMTNLTGDQFLDRELPTDQNLLYQSFWKYTAVNAVQYVCSHQKRFGPTGDTGYNVCLDKAWRPGKPCIIYSFGSRFEFGFEKELIKDHQCEVHTYDPSLPIADHVIPKGVNFHLAGLGNSVTTNRKGWKMQTFSDIRRTLNHTKKTIDILKIDIEGGEWVALAHALQSGELRFVKQLQIEFHLWIEKRLGMSHVGMLTLLKKLYEQGFRIFYHEPWWLRNICNKVMRPPHPKITLCVNLCLVNTKYQPT